MKKAQIVLDPHLSDRPPAIRTDSYMRDIFSKLKQVAKISKECDITVFAGDMFHSKVAHRVSHRLVLATMRVLKRVDNAALILGNHDLMGAETKSSEFQPIGVLLESGVVRHLKSYRMGTLEILGVDYDQDFENGNKKLHLPKKDTERRLLVIHSMMGQVQWENLVGDYDYVVSGHEHNPVPEPTALYENCGALSRTRSEVSEFTRPICVSIIDEKLRVERRELDYRPWSEVSVTRKKLLKRSDQESADKAFDLFLATFDKLEDSAVDVERVLEGVEDVVADRVREYIGAL